MDTRLERIIHISPEALSPDPDSMAALCGIGHCVENLYALMETLRDDAASNAVPVAVSVGAGPRRLDARLPGLYHMDGVGDVLVQSTYGVDFIERRPLREAAPATAH